MNYHGTISHRITEYINIDYSKYGNSKAKSKRVKYCICKGEYL